MIGRVLAALVLLLTLPIHLVVSVLVKVSSPGTVFYVADRLGYRGQMFKMRKYRSMRVGSPKLVDAEYRVVTDKADRRLTWVGWLIRCGIDELPQLASIVSGRMAWIGPRPDEPWMLPFYRSALRERLEVLPGITGYAQVLDGRHIRVAESYALDIWHIANRSIALNLWIVALTPLYMLGWRSIGRRRLERHRANPEHRALVGQIASTLATKALSPAPGQAGLGLEHETMESR